MHVDGSVVVELEKTGEAAGVIVVTVRQNGRIHQTQIDAQQRGVAGEGVRLSGVEENAVFFRFDVQAQTVLRGETVVRRQIIQKRNDFHVTLLAWGYHSRVCRAVAAVHRERGADTRKKKLFLLRGKKRNIATGRGMTTFAAR